MKTYQALFLAMLPLCSYAKELNCNLQQTCEVVIDAGSSGTRLNVYQFNERSFSKDTKITLIHRNEIKKALHTFDPSSFDKDFQALFNFTTKKPLMVYFYATAGLRDLEPQKRKNLINQVKQWFNKHPYFDLKELRTLKGDEEGVLAWVSTAFLEQQDNPNFDLLQSGIVEIGGSSAQISFPLNQSMQSSEHHVYSLSWFGKNINLWSVSLPHFGMQKAYHYLLDQSSCYSFGYRMPNGVLAKGNLSSCIQSLSKRHPLNGFLKPTVAALEHQKIQNWYGFGAIAYMGSSPVLEFQNGSYQLQQLFKNADKNACQMNWNNLVKQYSTLPFLDRTCMTSAYVYWFASQALNMPEKTPFIYKQKNQKDSWTLGSVVIRHMPS